MRSFFARLLSKRVRDLLFSRPRRPIRRVSTRPIQVERLEKREYPGHLIGGIVASAVLGAPLIEPVGQVAAIFGENALLGVLPDRGSAKASDTPPAPTPPWGFRFDSAAADALSRQSAPDSRHSAPDSEAVFGHGSPMQWDAFDAALGQPDVGAQGESAGGPIETLAPAADVAGGGGDAPAPGGGMVTTDVGTADGGSPALTAAPIDMPLAGTPGPAATSNAAASGSSSQGPAVAIPILPAQDSGSSADPTPRVNHETPPVARDADLDGLDAEIEAAAPNGGDGNRDGVADADQAGVASLRATGGGPFVTLDAHGHALAEVSATRAPDHPVEGYRLPLGLFSFKVTGVAPGGTASVSMTLPDGVNATTYLKQDPATGAFSRFDYDGTTGAEINGNQITLHFVDGGRGDADGIANGVILDPGGPGSPGTLMTVPCPNPSGSTTGWTVVESGGTSGKKGSVSAVLDDYYLLSEGDSHLVSLQRDFTVPANPSFLEFKYSNLSLDGTDTDSINDAFEAALLDPATGRPLVYTIATGRDSFFNVSEDVGVATGKGTVHSNGAVQLDISKLFAGTTARLVFRLVNNDSDTGSSVRVLCEEVRVGGPLSVDEGSSYTLELDPHGRTGITGWTINWGDGQTSTAGALATSATHTYADGTRDYLVTASASTASGSLVASPFFVHVNNVAPSLTSNAPTYEVVRGSDGTDRLVMTVSGSFTDPGFTDATAGTAETFDAVIDWGDGTVDTVAATIDTKGAVGTKTAGSFKASHTYQHGGAIASLYVVDDDGGASDTQTQFVVPRIKVKPVVDPANVQGSVDYLGTIPVVIFSDPGIDALKLDPATINFGIPGRGPTEGADEAHAALHPHDEIPVDGLRDDVAHFGILDTGFLQNDPLAFILGTPGVLTADMASTAGQLAGVPVFALGNVGILPNTLQGAEEVLDAKTLASSTKFFVADDGTDSVYKYRASSTANGSFAINPGGHNPRGIASSPTGDKVWVIDGVTGKVSVQGPSGTVQGVWQASDVTSPQGIVNVGLDLWVVDKGSKTVRRYVNGALKTVGSASADTSFALDAANASPSDLTGDGAFIWVTDDAAAKVFVYTVAGKLEGSWDLDIFNQAPSGITRNPLGGDDLWVLDRADKRVYRYEGATARRTGIQGYSDSFALVAANASPEGIADPCQAFSGAGTDFWLANTGPAAFSNHNMVFITGEQDASGTVSIPGTGWSTPFTFTGPGSATVLVGGQLTANDAVQSLGIHVTASSDVRVYRVSEGPPEEDRYAAYPTSALGTEYFVLAYGNASKTAVPSEFALVAAENNTQVTITPSVTTGTRTAGVPYTITMNQGQTYQLRNSTSGADLTGTSIVATKPVAVFAGNEKADVNGGATAYVTEALPPTSLWSNHYVTMPIADHAGDDLIRVMAAENGTDLFVNGTKVKTLSSGAVYETLLDAAAEFTANKPILVAQYARTAGVPDDDVFMMLVPAVDQFGTAYQALGTSDFIAIPYNGERFNIIVPAAGVGTVSHTIGGTATTIPANQYTKIGTGAYYGTQYNSGHSGGRLTGPVPFGAVHYTIIPSTGSGQDGQFGYPLLGDPAPPSISITAPGEGDEFPAYSYQIISGLAQAGASAIASVTVNGVPVDALDEAGHFFARVYVGPGVNSYTAQVLDARGKTAADTVTVKGVEHAPGSERRFDVTPSLEVQYGRTSFNEATDDLFADLRVENTGQYPIDAPLWVVVSDISDPTVAVRNPDGFTGDGLPYYDFSSAVGDAVLDPGETTAYLGLDFFNPRNVRFDYQLRFLARPDGPPAFTTLPPVEAVTGRAYAYDAAATDPDGDAVTFELVAGPAGMTLDTAAGVLAWTPATDEVGLHDVTLRAKDSRGNFADQAFSVSVTAAPPNRPPVFTLVPTPEAYVNTAYAFTLAATDPDGNALAYSVSGTPPAGLSVNSTTGVITWTPTAAQAGSQSATFVASDGLGGVARLTATFCVLPEPDTVAPVIITAPAAVSIRQGQTLSYTARAADADGDTITYSLTAPPSGMSVNSSTGRITWNTTGVSAGTYTATIKAADGRGWADSYALAVTVVTTTAGSISGLVFDDADGDGIQDVGEGGLSGRTVFLDRNQDGLLDAGETTVTTGGTGAYTFSGLGAGGYRVRLQPASGRVTTSPLGGGSYFFHDVTLSAGGSVAAKDFGSKAVAAGDNKAPQVLTTAPTSASIGVLFRYDAEATDDDGDALTFDLPLAPEGMAVDALSGIVGWRPGLGQVGTHDAILRVKDGKGGVRLEALKVTVGSPNTPPVITSTAGTSAKQTRPYQYAVLAQDAEGSTLTYSLTGSPPSGMSINSSTGVISWTPTTSQLGAYTATVSVSDGTASTTQTFGLNVFGFSSGNNLPVRFSDAPTKAQIGLKYYYRPVVLDPDSDQLTYSLTGTPPTGMTIDAATGLIQWTPAQNQLGNSTVNLQVSDGVGSITETFTVAVLARYADRAPAIVSTPPRFVSVGRAYAYNLVAADPDGEPVAWTLEKAPVGVSLDRNRGTLRWTPGAHQAGPQEFLVRAADPYGRFDLQSFTLDVADCNAAPLITSMPRTTAAVASPYYYAVRATDADGDTLSFSLVGTPPSGMTINSSSGLLSWTPAATGTFTATVRVSDGQGASAEQTYSIVVSAPVDRPPVIESTPVRSARVGFAYSYQVEACDPEHHALTYSLPVKPTGMNIDAKGLITWTPSAAGTFDVTVKVTDPGGKAAYQHFRVVARTNSVPSITSTAPTAETAGRLYRYDVAVDDTDGDPIIYTLDQASIDRGMSIDRYGRLAWQVPVLPTGSTAKVYAVTIDVADPYGGTDSESYNLTISADNELPNLQVDYAKTVRRNIDPVDQGKVQADFFVRVSDNVGVTAAKLTIVGPGGTPTTNLALEGSGGARMVFDTDGTYTINAEAADAAGNTAKFSSTFDVVNAGGTPPTVTLTAPSPGVTITTPVDVTGSIADTDLSSWSLTLIEDDGGPTKTLASGTTTFTSKVIAQVDPTFLANGSYTLRLRATDAAGWIITKEQTVSIAGNLKLGDFTMEFTDLEIPVSGIPIQVTRTYDTLQANNKGDFGYGWRLSFGDPDLKVSIPDGGGTGWGRWKPFKDGTRVFLTSPDGQRQGFTFSGELVNSFFQQYAPVFTPDSDNTADLEVADVLLYKTSDGEYFSYDEAGLHSYNPADPAYGGKYTLHTLDLLKYEIDADSGKLTNVSDLRGNRLTFTDDAITSNTGRAVAISRNPDGRVIAITDPRGNSVSYGYDAAGDLVSVTDRLGNTTQFVYRTDKPHYLDKVVDPFGRQGVRTAYASDGRLSQVKDAQDKTVDLAYNVSARTQTITDQNSKSATVYFDTRGNVTQTTDQTNRVMLATYQAGTPYLTSQTQVVGTIGGSDDITTTITIDSKGRPLTQTDPEGNTSQVTYNDLGLPMTMSDPLGNTTFNSIDQKGNLLGTVSPLTAPTLFTYDSRGNVLTATVSNATTTNEYDEFGQRTATTGPNGVRRTFSYDANGNQTESTFLWTNPNDPDDIRLLTTTNVYDAADRLIRTIDPDGNITRTEYDILNRPVKTWDIFNQLTETTYDSRGLVIETKSPLGSITRTVYDAAGRVSWTVDEHEPGEQAHGTQTIYDEAGRVRFVKRWSDVQISITTLADGSKSSSLAAQGTLLSSTETHYDAAGRVDYTVDTAGEQTDFGYDKRGLQTSVTNALNEVTETRYDAAGRAVLSEDGLNQQTRTEYDAAGRPVKVILEDGTFVTTAYDNRGRKTAETDQLGRTTNYEYDDQGRLTAVVLPQTLDPETNSLVRPRYEYEYDQYGNNLLIRDAKGRETLFSYDEHNRQVSRTLPDGATETWQYNARGQLIEHVDFKGQRETSSYDSFGRLSGRQWFASGSSTVGDSVTYQYDDLGRMDSYTDARGTTSYSFDLDGRTTQIASPEGTINYGYDAATGRHTETWTAYSDLTYGYDELGRLKTVSVIKRDGTTLGTPEVTTYRYNAVGMVDRVTHGNGVVSDYTFDDLNRVISVTHKTGVAGAVITDYDYTRRDDGKIETVVESDAGGTVSQTDYLYDELGRLIQEDYDGVAAGTDYTTEYTLDVVGNRLEKQTQPEGGLLQVVLSTHDSRDRLLTETSTVGGQSAGLTTYGYDANGSLTSRMTTGLDSATYAWDLRNRLLSAAVTGASGLDTTGYVYDDSGIMVRRTENGVTRFLLIDTNNPTGYAQVIEERESGLLVASFVYGLEPLSQSQGTVISHYLTDIHSGVRLLLNPSGVVLNRDRYDAFGNVVAHTGTAVNRVLYRGERIDAVTVWVNLRARPMDPQTGRFPAMDPVPGNPRNPTELHRYVYTGGDPINRIDPAGTEFLIGLTVGLNVQSNMRAQEGAQKGSFLTRGLRNKAFDIYLILEKNKDIFPPVHAGVFVANRRTNAGPRLDVGLKGRSQRARFDTSGVLQQLFGIWIGEVRIERASLAELRTDPDRLFRSPIWIASFNQRQMIAWTLTIAVFPADVTAVPYNMIPLGVIPGTGYLNCYKWTLEVLALAKLYSYLPF